MALPETFRLERETIATHNPEIPRLIWQNRFFVFAFGYLCGKEEVRNRVLINPLPARYQVSRQANVSPEMSLWIQFKRSRMPASSFVHINSLQQGASSG